MDYSNHMVLHCDCRSENEAFARAVVAAFATQLNPTLNDLADIKTAVSEAVTNTIIHGYRNQPGIITIEAEIGMGVLLIKIIDQGRGIADIAQARQPLYTTQPELERSGMGFTVMETFMDSLEVISELDKGTTVIMVKHIGAPKSGADAS